MSTMASTSPFYPPRAKWYSRIFYFGLATRHKLALDRIRLPHDVTFLGLIAGLLVPGLAVYLRGPRFWGKVAMATSAFLFALFIVWFGYPFGNYAFGLIVSLHVSGFAYYCSPLLREESFGFRIGFTALLLVAIGLGVYMPTRHLIQSHFLMPLRVNEQVVVVQRFSPANQVQRGEVVAYTLSGYYFSNHGGEGVSTRSGVGLGTVLGTAGDRVEFSKNGVLINGRLQPALPHMPTEGSLVVLENHWFVWPTLAITGNWHVPEASLSSAMLQLSDVPETRYAGKPFKRWFWREQTVP